MARMVFGHNSNVKFGAHTFHVQTEDRGANNALIDTTVYFQGRVLHRRTNSYIDLLPLNDDTEQALKLRVDEQHRNVLDEIRSGHLQLAIPPANPVAASAQEEQAPESHGKMEERPVAPAQARKLSLELLNARSWLAGKQATLHLAVRGEGGMPVAGVHVSAEVEGSAGHPAYVSKTDGQGQATISFEMPRITEAEAALVIRAGEAEEEAHLRFGLRAKPRVPAV